MNALNCHNCEADLEEKHKFCPQCGLLIERIENKTVSKKSKTESYYEIVGENNKKNKVLKMLSYLFLGFLVFGFLSSCVNTLLEPSEPTISYDDYDSGEDEFDKAVKILEIELEQERIFGDEYSDNN